MSTAKDIVTRRIIEIINSGNVLPWNSDSFALDRSNFLRRIPYSALNQIMLSRSDDRFFMSKKEIIGKKLRWKVGSRWDMITFWKVYEKETGKVVNGKPVMDSIPVLRFYKVLGISDIIGVDREQEDLVVEDPIPIDRLIEGSTARIVIDNTVRKAVYNRETDTILTPRKEEFEKEDYYYGGLCRELIRWTAHQGRIEHRDPEDDEEFGMESLIADIGSAILRKAYGFEYEEQTAAVVDRQLRGWVDTLEQNSSLIITAASRAEKAIDLLKSLSGNEENVFDMVRGI